MNSPVPGMSRTTRSVNIDPVQTSPFLSTTVSYGLVRGVGGCHSWNSSVRGSNIPITLPPNPAYQTRSCESTSPLRGRDPVVGVS